MADRARDGRDGPGVGDTLYHATYEPYLASILEHGLGGAEVRKNYEDSEDGVTYLAASPEVAVSYAEVSEEVPEAYLDLIVVLAIPVSALDPHLLGHDRNVRGGVQDLETHAYRGVIRTLEVLGPDPSPAPR